MKLAQCWDDGVHDDIRVIEILRRHGAKGSFNLNYALHKPVRSGGWSERYGKDILKLALPELTEVYDGFLVANHTATHPHLADILPCVALRDIRDGRDALEQHFGYPVTGFAYPFGQYDDDVKEMVRETGHVYARTTRNTDTVLPPEDPMAFHASCHFLAPDFWERFERVQAADKDGDAAVFYFWGHSYELVTEDQWRDFDAKIARLSATPGAEWVDLPGLFAGEG